MLVIKDEEFGNVQQLDELTYDVVENDEARDEVDEIVEGRVKAERV